MVELGKGPQNGFQMEKGREVTLMATLMLLSVRAVVRLCV